jgi:hypothetical protein
MNGMTREFVRRRRDVFARERMAAFVAAGELEVCSLCGCDTDATVVGCAACSERHRMRQRREDPSTREKLQASQRASRARRRAARRVS